MRRCLTVIALAIFASRSAASVGDLTAQDSSRRAAVLFKAFENRALDDQLPAVLATLAPEVRTEVVRRLARRQMYVAQTPLPPPSAEFPWTIVIRARRSMEVGMVALLETRDMADAAQTAIEREAFEYARDAKLYYEWEGYQDGPFDEANSAVAYLAAHPQSTLRPYLDLFVLHRYRCAFEAAGWEAADQGAARRAANLADEQRAATLYKEVWERISISTDPVVRMIAIDLDTAAFVYLNIGLHPRTYVG
jgi:hypothetical protein